MTRREKKRRARWERYKRTMRKRCRGYHVPTAWSWAVGFYRYVLCEEVTT